MIVCKPWPSTFKIALARAGVAAENCIFADDNVRNVAGAQSAGIFSVLVGHTEPHPSADLTIKSILDLPAVLPQLFGAPPS